MSFAVTLVPSTGTKLLDSPPLYGLQSSGQAGFALLGFFIFILLALGGGFAGLKVFGCCGSFWQWHDWPIAVLRQIKTEAAGGSITSITKAKHSFGVSPKFVAIFKLPKYYEPHVISWESRKIVLRNCAECRHKDRISSYCIAFPLFSNGASFYIPSPRKKSLKGMGICYTTRLFRSASRQKGRVSSPSELRREMPAVLKVDQDFSAGFTIRWDYEVGNNAVFSSYRDMSTLAEIQGRLSEYISFFGRQKQSKGDSSIYHDSHQSPHGIFSYSLLDPKMDSSESGLSFLESIGLSLSGLIIINKAWWKLYNRPDSGLYGIVLFLGCWLLFFGVVSFCVKFPYEFLKAVIQ